MTLYVSDNDLNTWLGLDDQNDFEKITVANAASKTAIDKWVGRNFDTSTVDSVRYFSPISDGCCPINDAITITTVAVDSSDDGTWATTLDASDWFATPVGGISPSGEPGWPYTAIYGSTSTCFRRTARPYLKVTAKWGWAAVPDDIKLAARLYAAELFKLNEAPLGTSWTEAGAGPIIRGSRPLQELLQPYNRNVGIA